MKYTKDMESKIRVLVSCYKNSTDITYDLKCIKEAYKNNEMSEWEYKYALQLLKQAI